MSIHSRVAIAGLALLSLFCGSQAYGQSTGNGAQTPPSQSSQPNSQGRVTRQQSVVVTANLTPEESEEGKINEAYQSVYAAQRDHDCAGIIDRCRSVIIPLAEKAKFDVPRNKFLYLSYRSIGDCELNAEHFAEAEKMFQKAMEYLPVWPGLNDSDYPIAFTSIGVARMGQQNWKSAEESLQKAVALFDEQIERAARSDQEFVRTEHSNNLRMSQDWALLYLAIVYFREGRATESLALLDKAYGQATKFNAPAAIVKQIVESGLSIASTEDDSAANAIWSERAKAAK